jgi:hypothetical protein
MTRTVASQSVLTTTAANGRLGGDDPATTATMFLPEPSDPASGGNIFDGGGTSVAARVTSSGASRHHIETMARSAGLGLFILLPTILLVN